MASRSVPQKADEYSNRLPNLLCRSIGRETLRDIVLWEWGLGAYQAGARGSKDISEGWSDTESVHTNKNLLLMQSLDAGAVEQAKTEYLEQHGALPAANSKAHKQIYARAGELFRCDFEDLVKTTQATPANDIKSMGVK